MRAMTLFQAVLASAMLSTTGCTGTGPSSDCKDAECTDDTNPDCPDCIGPDNSAFLKVNVTTAGVPAPCNVNINGALAGPTGQLIEIPAGDQITAQIGSIETMTEEDNPRPIHDLEGLRWVYPDIEIEAAPGETIEMDAPMNRYFTGNYVCTYDTYHWSGSTSDNKGDLFRSDEDPPQRISVVDGLYVEPESGFSGTLAGTGERFNVSGDTLVLDSTTWGISSSQINDDGSFRVTIAEDSFSVIDISCVP